MIIDEIVLEPYFDERGILLVREKVMKKNINLLRSVSLQNDVDGMPMQELTISVLINTSVIDKQIEDMNNGKA